MVSCSSLERSVTLKTPLSVSFVSGKKADWLRKPLNFYNLLKQFLLEVRKTKDRDLTFSSTWLPCKINICCLFVVVFFFNIMLSLQTILNNIFRSLEFSTINQSFYSLEAVSLFPASDCGFLPSILSGGSRWIREHSVLQPSHPRTYAHTYPKSGHVLRLACFEELPLHCWTLSNSQPGWSHGFNRKWRTIVWSYIFVSLPQWGKTDKNNMVTRLSVSGYKGR